MILVHRRCRRCGGQMAAQKDHYGPRVHCLICGWDDPKVGESPEIVDITPLRRSNAAETK